MNSCEDVSNKMKSEDTMPKTAKTQPQHPKEQRKDVYQQHELIKQVHRNRMYEAKKRQDAKREHAEYARR